MKPVLLVILVSLLALTTVTKGGSTDDKAGKKTSSLLLPIPKKYENSTGISLFFEGKISHDPEAWLQCRMVNRTNSSIYFEGIATDFPLYRIQTWDGKNWNEYGVGWCSLSMQSIELPLNKSTVFEFLAPLNSSAFRVGVTLADPKVRGFGKDLPTIWTEKIKLRKD